MDLRILDYCAIFFNETLSKLTSRHVLSNDCRRNNDSTTVEIEYGQKGFMYNIDDIIFDIALAWNPVESTTLQRSW